MKRELQNKFNELFTNKRLLAVQLNGFSHKAFYDDGSSDSEIQVFEYSGYMSDAERSKNENDKASLFKGIGHSFYQNNAQEIIYIMPKDR